MTLNGVMAVTLRYVNKFGEPAFHLRTTCSSIKLIERRLLLHIEWWV